MILTLLIVAVLASPALAADRTKNTSSDRRAAADQHGTALDINTATLEELEALPGVGKATAKQIAEKRPYARKDDLLTKKVVSRSTYDKIKDQIVARGDAMGRVPDRSGTRTHRERPSSDVDSSSSRSGGADRGTGGVSASPKSGIGKVWVNTSTGVYHHDGDVWYGKTKQGKYMTENEAIRAGYRESKQTTQ
jgi:hypothetical protein